MSGSNGYWQKHDGMLLSLQKNDKLMIFDGRIEDDQFKVVQVFQLLGGIDPPNMWADEDGMVAIYDSVNDRLAFYHEEVEAPYQWCNRDISRDLPKVSSLDEDLPRCETHFYGEEDIPRGISVY